MLKKENVLETLKECYDPEIPINIVDLGLIYDIQIKGNTVNIKMSLTTRGCPMAEILRENVKQKLEELKEVKNADVEIVWDPPWTPDRVNPETKKILGT